MITKQNNSRPYPLQDLFRLRWTQVRRHYRWSKTSTPILPMPSSNRLKPSGRIGRLDRECHEMLLGRPFRHRSGCHEICLVRIWSMKGEHKGEGIPLGASIQSRAREPWDVSRGQEQLLRESLGLITDPLCLFVRGQIRSLCQTALVLKLELVDVPSLVNHVSSDFEMTFLRRIVRRLPLWQLFLLARGGMY
jgi:hypothetical protein